MTTPEENARKTGKTDQAGGTPARPDEGRDRREDREARRDRPADPRPAVGAALQDALEQADRDRDDLTG
ncbi:hypothetical protein ACFY4C_27190 [Actinomadura viridis]|uniref:hypothetical protein n=1 Tax=Actinomadura viridis TaxID=58110 RepID=UPI0036D15369